MRNKRGSGLGIAIIVSITFFIIGLMAINYITPEVTRARLPVTGLDCANATIISDGNKLTCLAVDMAVPYFILLVFSAAIGYVSTKFIT